MGLSGNLFWQSVQPTSIGRGLQNSRPRDECPLWMRAFVIPATRAAGPLQLPERAAQRFNLLLIAGFLALGQFGQFQRVLHLVECALERLDDLRNLVNRLADGRALRPAPGRHLAGDRGNCFEQGWTFRCRLRGGCRRRSECQRRAAATAATTTTTMSPPTRSGNRYWLSVFWHVWANHALAVRNWKANSHSILPPKLAAVMPQSPARWEARLYRRGRYPACWLTRLPSRVVHHSFRQRMKSANGFFSPFWHPLAHFICWREPSCPQSK